MRNTEEDPIASARAAKQTHRRVTALSRGLDVLIQVGLKRSTVAEIAAHTRLNRTTVYRFLATLEADGYLIRSPSNHEYRLSSKVRLLSDGFTDPLWVTQIAAPVLMQLLKKTSWPGSLATFDGRFMVFRETTHRFGSFFVHKPMIGRQVPLSSALGQAFLAFSGEAIRRPLLKPFIYDWEQSGFGRMGIRDAQRHLGKVRSRGFATAIGSIEADVAAIGRPIMRNGQVLACMNIVMSPEAFANPSRFDAVQRHLADAIGGIEAELNQQ
ncbi:helix-turn-helix domain-containing protein [Sphingobium sp. SJ10-10]|uniref:helix-turn-helix domain-containing protein n=1 Tax=unclassified Sphingobium TaxID=2611147 RepID=UPI00076FF7DF|nr:MULTISPECIES: helix-turn-helix domain-containing protein [unclassified Sphingobium]AMK24669.1 DNA-binding transcriptional activator MhpR [Sphingobium sp. TKS]MEC6698198.1 helix-turn-helix domain-containing protein [Sphingobium sp. SJ10-10]